ncbi:MAG: hypothetical protein NTY19_03960 [Planctomycetota bacterium]|nr:hypothetical protein [Planctomycetota bacterium]
MQKFVKKTTAPYDSPRLVAFFETVPKASAGKIRRHRFANRVR